MYNSEINLIISKTTNQNYKRNPEDIITGYKLAVKVGAIVILNRNDYIQEGLRQLDNQEYCSPLDNYLTKNFNAEILHIIKQATNLCIIDYNMQKHCTTNFLISSLYELPTNA